MYLMLQFGLYLYRALLWQIHSEAIVSMATHEFSGALVFCFPSSALSVIAANMPLVRHSCFNVLSYCSAVHHVKLWVEYYSKCVFLRHSLVHTCMLNPACSLTIAVILEVLTVSINESESFIWGVCYRFVIVQ